MIKKGVGPVVSRRAGELNPWERSISNVERIQKEEEKKIKNKLKSIGSY